MKKLLFFPKKIFVGQMDHLVTKRAHPHNSGSTVKIVLQFCTMKEAKRDIDIILTVFLKKKSYSRQFCHFGPKLVHNLNVLNLLSGVFLIFCLIKAAQS